MNAGEKDSVTLGLEIIPNSKKFGIMGFNPWTNSLRVKVVAKAQKGRANDEIIEEMEKLFRTTPRIVSGEKSRKKKLRLIGISEGDAKKALLSKIAKQP